MSNLLRVKCSCGEVANAAPGNVCPKCHQPFPFPEDALITLYRKGNFFGCAGGFGLYFNNEPYGYIGNCELIRIPLKYGSYKLHVAVGMNRKCNDLIFNLTPENRFAFAKISIRPGFWTNSFDIEPCSYEDMPQDK